MDVTVCYAHMKYPSHLKVGDTVKYGDSIGIIGDTGFSKLAHLHIWCYRGWIKRPVAISEVESGKFTPDFRQLMYFMDDDLFKRKIRIEATPVDISYFKRFKKVHYGYDAIPFDFRLDKDFWIYYNRSFTGTIIAKGYDPEGYGNYLHVGLKV